MTYECGTCGRQHDIKQNLVCKKCGIDSIDRRATVMPVPVIVAPVVDEIPAPCDPEIIESAEPAQAEKPMKRYWSKAKE